MTAGDQGKSITIVLRDFPLAPWSSMRQWFEEVRREISLAGLSHDEPAAVVLAGLTSVLDRQSRVLGAPDRGQSAMWAALEAGAVNADIRYSVAPEAAVSSGDMAEATDALDALCHSGALLTLPMSPVAKAFAQWYFGEIQHQVNGIPPMSWSDVGQAAQ